MPFKTVNIELETIEIKEDSIPCEAMQNDKSMLCTSKCRRIYFYQNRRRQIIHGQERESPQTDQQ